MTQKSHSQYACPPLSTPKIKKWTGKRGQIHGNRRFDCGGRARNAIFRSCIIKSYTWNLYNLINQCHLNKVNKKPKLEDLDYGKHCNSFLYKHPWLHQWINWVSKLSLVCIVDLKTQKWWVHLINNTMLINIILEIGDWFLFKKICSSNGVGKKEVRKEHF